MDTSRPLQFQNKNSEFWEERISVQKGGYKFPTLGGMRNCLMTTTLCHLHGHSLVLKCMSLWVCPKPIFHINAFSWAFWQSSGSYSRSIQVLFFELVLESISLAASFVFLYYLLGSAEYQSCMAITELWCILSLAVLAVYMEFCTSIYMSLWTVVCESLWSTYKYLGWIIICAW
jgi:hypothetical protein